MAERGKKYLETVKGIDRSQAYPPQQAIELAKKASFVRFDETLEVHVRTNLDPRRADHQLRGLALLPHGTGKKVRVLVFAQGEAEGVAEQAGADIVGSDDLIKRIEEGFLEFDIAFATPDMMGKLGKLGRVLGRRGLMPNPRSGTVVAAADLPRALGEARRGRVEFRLDRTAIIHVPLGKLSFDTDKLVENLATFIEAIVRARPSGAKGQFIKSIHLSSTMGPGIKLEPRSTFSLARA